MDINTLFRKAADGEDRSVKILVYDDPDVSLKETPKIVFQDNSRIIWGQGLAVRDGKIVKFDVLNPTVTYKVTVSAWYRLIAQQNTFTDLYWTDRIDASGEYFLRDIVVWNKFWEQYKDVVKLNIIDKALLKDKEEDIL